LIISALEKSYKGGDTSSYHPRMLLKVSIYAYLRNLYSSRKIEQALYENIHFMWLSGQSKPDHNTINDFRGKRLQKHLKKIFHQVVLLLAEEGVLSLKDLFVDGTKIEANANGYTFVWGKSIKTSKGRIKKQLNELWSYVEKVYKEERKTPYQPDFEAISSDKIEATINKINDALQGKQIDKKVKQKLNYAKKNWTQNMAKYEEVTQEKPKQVLNKPYIATKLKTVMDARLEAFAINQKPTEL
jgi:transposase